jgi:RND family efflux transporter MFP subunit
MEKLMSKKHLLLKVVLPVLILLVGVGLTVAMVKSKQPLAHVEQPVLGALVEAHTVTRGAHQVRVFATGTVQPRRAVAIAPQVAGRVTKVADKFVVGGFFAAGELLFAIEPTDYEIALEQASANVTRAELELTTIEGKARIAREEWTRMHGDDGTEPNPLVLYQPQVKNAEASLRAARALARQAQVNLGRTKIVAPFASYVRTKQLDLGQFVRSGITVAEVVGSDQAEIVVPLPIAELDWIEIPRAGEKAGSSARVKVALDGREKVWNGRVTRMFGDIGSRDRMARVVVTVADPYGLEAVSAGPSLATGLFVSVELHGTTLPDVALIPRDALRGNDAVWLYKDGGQLEIKPVEVLRREQQQVVIGSGLNGGERLILTTLTGVTDGMQVRLSGETTER